MEGLLFRFHAIKDDPLKFNYRV